MKLLDELELTDSLDLKHYPLKNLRVENLASAPASPEQGYVYYDTTLKTCREWNGTDWHDLGRATMVFGPVQAQTTFGSASANGSSGNAARADHKHGTPVHDDAAHAAVKLSAFAAPTASIDCGNQRLTNAAAPIAGKDLVNKDYADQLMYGLDYHASVDLIAVNEIVLSGEQQIDGKTTDQTRVLVAGQGNGTYNGIYITGTGDWERALDANQDEELRPGSLVYVLGGKEHAREVWLCNACGTFGISGEFISAPWVADGNADFWTQFSSPQDIQAGIGLHRFGNRFDVMTDADSGIDLSSGYVRADFGLLPRKVAMTIGDGEATEFTIPVGAHITTVDAIVQVFELATGETVGCNIVRGTGAVYARFTTAPDADSLRVLIHL